MESNLTLWLSSLFCRAIHESGRVIDDFTGITQKPEQPAHAYGQFRLSPDVKKPLFEEVCQTVKTYIDDGLPEIQGF